MIIALTVIVALGILGWGFYRARPFGKVGILAWLQSAVLMAPWLIFFGLVAVNIYLNLIGILGLFVLSTGLYIGIGRQLRGAAQPSSAPIADAGVTSDPTPIAAPITAPITPPIASDPPLALPIPAADLQIIRGIFGIDTFFATETIPYQDGAIFRGNLRGDAEPIFTQLSQRLRDRVGDRYRLFLVQNQEEKPVIVVLPSANDPQPATIPQKLLAGLLLLATIATSLETAGLLLGFDLFSTPQRWRETVAIGGGFLAVMAIHELGHWLLARHYQVRLSVPFLIPTWQIGSFGAITRFESLLLNRTQLFDIALAGPAAGGAAAFVMLITGLGLSHPGSMFKVPTEFFEGSILVGTLARLVLGNAVQQPTIDVNPLVILGWLGLIVTAINLMPAGQLDGGRIVQAIYGRKTLGNTTIATIAVLAIAALVNPLALYWAIEFCCCSAPWSVRA